MSYKTLYTNQLHQVLVTVSKHLYFTSKGKLKYQRKKLEVSLQDLSSSEKNHLVHFSIRDHFSNLVYAEVTESNNMISLRDFLKRAWTPKTNILFKGKPQYLMLTKLAEDYFQIESYVNDQGIHVDYAKSGFELGIKNIPKVEGMLAFQEGETDIEKLQQIVSSTSLNRNKKKARRLASLSCEELWEHGLELMPRKV